MAEPSTDKPADKTDSAPKPPRRRSRALKYLLRFLFAVLVLLIALAVAVQIVLRSDIPRKVIVAQLQRSLGLRVAAQSASVSWAGDTILHDVTLSLPLSEQPMVDVPSMTVSHTIVPFLLLGRPLRIKSVALDRPTLNLIQDDSGRWNVVRAFAIASRSGEASVTSPQLSRTVPSIPAITIADGTINVTDNRLRTTSIAPVALHGEPDGALVWRCDGGVESRVEITGHIAPGDVWEHSLMFEVQDIRPWLTPWIADAPMVAGSGNWRGRVSGPLVSGRAELTAISVGSYSASGAAQVDRDDSGITVQPANLVVNTPDKMLPQARLRSGQILIAGPTVRVRSIAVSAAGGAMQLDGQWDRAAGSANVELAWRDIALPAGTRQQGTMTASLLTPLPGAQRIKASIFSGGRTPDGSWEGKFDVEGIARAPQRSFGQPSATQPVQRWAENFDWIVKAPTLGWRGGRAFAAQDILAHLHSRGAQITLNDVSIAGKNKLAGRGELDLMQKRWWLWLAGSDFAMARPRDAALGFNLLASGDGPYTQLEELLVHINPLNFWLGGTYDARLPKPVAAALHIWRDPQLAPLDRQIARGDVRGSARLSGTLWPRNLELDGHLITKDLVVNDRPIGDSDIALTGQIDEKQIALETKNEATLLGGKWRARALSPTEDEASTLVLEVRDVPVEEITALLKGPPGSGLVSGAFTFETRRFDLDDLNVRGEFNARDIAVEQLLARRVTGHLTLRDGQVTVDPIELEQGDGHARGRISFLLNRRNVWQVACNAKDWPLKFSEGATARATADANLLLDLSQPAASGALHGAAQFQLDQQDAGQAVVDATADGRTINVIKLSASALGGSAQGQGVFPLDRPDESVARVELKEIDAAQLARFVPKTDGLSGKISGIASLAPADNTRAVAPLKIQLDLAPQDARFRTLPIGQITATAYLDPGQSLRDVRRFILNDSTFRLGEGTVHIWARTSRHPERRVSTRSSQVQVDFEDVDLDQLSHAINPKSNPAPGKLAGSVVLAGDPSQRQSLFGNGRCHITKSNLAQTKLIHGLYDLMHLGAGDAGPAGGGEVDLLLQDNTLVIRSFRYFNRGTDIRANGTINDVWKIPQSPIDGYAFGSLRPLKDIRLPFMAQADQIFTALQKDAVAAKLGGTVADPHEHKIAFGDVSEGLRRMILGEVKSELAD